MKDLPYRDQAYDTREAAIDEHKGPEGQHTRQPDGIDGSLVRRYLSGEPHRHGEQRRIDERGDGGYFWDALAQYHLHSGRVELEDAVGFDSESSMFCMYSSSESALRRFAESFKEACADPETLKEMLQGFGEYLDY